MHDNSQFIDISPPNWIVDINQVQNIKQLLVIIDPKLSIYEYISGYASLMQIE